MWDEKYDHDTGYIDLLNMLKAVILKGFLVHIGLYLYCYRHLH